jgi:hypothetical protein
LRFSGICEDDRTDVREEELHYFELKSILKLLVVKDVLSHDLPVKNVRTFTTFCKNFIFPFIQVTSGDYRDEDGNGEEDFNGGQMIQSSPGNSNQLCVEIWGRAPGLFQSEI